MTEMSEIMGEGILPWFTMKFLNLTLKDQEETSRKLEHDQSRSRCYRTADRKLFSNIASLISDHYSALARLINLLRRAGKLDECSKYLEQVCVQFFMQFLRQSPKLFPFSDIFNTCKSPIFCPGWKCHTTCSNGFWVKLLQRTLSVVRLCRVTDAVCQSVSYVVGKTVPAVWIGEDVTKGAFVWENSGIRMYSGIYSGYSE